MINRAAATCLPNRNERLRRAALVPDERPRQGRRDPRPAPPDHRPAETTGPSSLPSSPLPREALRRLRLLVRPDTVLRWHRNLMKQRHANASRPKRPGQPAHRALHPQPDPAPGLRKPVIGLPAHPRRTRNPRDQSHRIHRLGDHQSRGHRPHPGAIHHHLGRFPALPGPRAPGPRLHRNHHPHRAAPVHPGRHRTLHPPHPGPRHHRASDRNLGHPVREDPRDGLGGRGRHGQVPDPSHGSGHSAPRGPRTDHRSGPPTSTYADTTDSSAPSTNTNMPPDRHGHGFRQTQDPVAHLVMRRGRARGGRGGWCGCGRVGVRSTRRRVVTG
jgi:hypothetical protein